jgi:hypothetical protein
MHAEGDGPFSSSSFTLELLCLLGESILAIREWIKSRVSGEE